MKVLVFGGNGWIGSHILPHLHSHEVVLANIRADSEHEQLKQYIMHIAPSHVLCVCGRTCGIGCVSVDYLEKPDMMKDNIRDNLYAPVSLALLCDSLNIHYTYIGTGCIFEKSNDEKKESNDANFFGSNYSIVKGFTDRLMKHFNRNILNVRIRMPLSTQVSMRNFITKITTFEKICSMPNSMTVLDACIPYLVQMMESEKIGTINLVNPGSLTHNEVLQMYKEIVDDSFTWKNFTEDDQAIVLSARRSNCVLNTEKLQTWYPTIPNIQEAVKECLENYKTKVFAASYKPAEAY
jgi:nucleoside-diphosphate-sugar epimerase